MSKPTRAMFFDLGGTLFSNRDIPIISIPVLQEAARRLGADDELAPVGAAYVKATQRANEIYMNEPFYMHRDLFLDTYRYFAEGLGTSASPEFIEWIYEAQREVMITRIRLREDCVDTLQGLRARGLTLAIVSNIDDDYLHPMIESLGLAPLFDHWSSSHEAESCKPDPVIFEYALQKAGCSADEVIFVGDSQLHDIKGAQAVGMTSVLIREKGGRSPLDVEDASPDHVIGSLSELVGLVGDPGLAPARPGASAE